MFPLKITMFHDSIPTVIFFWVVFNPSWKILVFHALFTRIVFLLSCRVKTA